MGIEIPRGPAGTEIVGEAGRISEPASAMEASPVDAATAPAAGDAVARVAQDLAAGRIDGDQAVEILLNDALGEALVQAAPESVRAELAETLAALIATDPHLAALARFLGARGEGRSPGEL